MSTLVSALFTPRACATALVPSSSSLHPATLSVRTVRLTCRPRPRAMPPTAPRGLSLRSRSTRLLLPSSSAESAVPHASPRFTREMHRDVREVLTCRAPRMAAVPGAPSMFLSRLRRARQHVAWSSTEAKAQASGAVSPLYERSSSRTSPRRSAPRGCWRVRVSTSSVLLSASPCPSARAPCSPSRAPCKLSTRREHEGSASRSASPGPSPTPPPLSSRYSS
mmetsp:Transcript_3456/g.11317  ORF Transcript_3456/g.11317 Transcript_3456/m.11317 type:complete len:222 (+) Transcript_3456:606-1271(+)